MSYSYLVDYINELHPGRMDLHFSVGGCWIGVESSNIGDKPLSWEGGFHNGVGGFKVDHIKYSYVINTGGGSDLLLDTYLNNMRGVILREEFNDWLVVRRSRMIDLVLLD